MYRGRFTKAPETWHVKSQDRGRDASHDGCGRRSRCYLRTLNAFSSSIGSDYEDRMVRATSSSSQQPPRTSENGQADTGTKAQAGIRAEGPAIDRAPSAPSSIYFKLSSHFFNRIGQSLPKFDVRAWSA